jgi:hypothetical protein
VPQNDLVEDILLQNNENDIDNFNIFIKFQASKWRKIRHRYQVLRDELVSLDYRAGERAESRLCVVVTIIRDKDMVKDSNWFQE